MGLVVEDMQYFSFSGIVSVFHEIYGIHLLKNGVLLTPDRKDILWIILKVADPRNWLFLLRNVV